MRISDWSSDVCSSDLPGVHLDEVECAVFPQELDRPRAAIAHIGHRLGDDAAHPITLDAAQDRRGGFLEHLLVAALERAVARSEEHTSELQSLMRISYAVFCLKKKKPD